MITSPDNEKLKLIRKLADRRRREREGLFVAEGEDLIAAAQQAGREPVFVLRAGEDVEPKLLDAVSTLGSGTRVIGVYEIPQPTQRVEWHEASSERTEPATRGVGAVGVYLHGVGDPANVGAIVRTTHALVGAEVVLGPGCADPYSPKAVRASMGSIFAVAPRRGGLDELAPPVVGLAAHGGAPPDDEPVGALALGAEREGLPGEVAGACDRLWTIPLRPGGAESLNVAAAAAIALGRISSAAREGLS